MLSHVILIATIMVSVGVGLNLWRLVLGPSLPDRILALDTMYINGIALLVLLGIARGTTIYLEVALVIAVLGFISTVAFAKYVLRGNIIE